MVFIFFALLSLDSYLFVAFTLFLQILVWDLCFIVKVFSFTEMGVIAV